MGCFLLEKYGVKDGVSTIEKDGVKSGVLKTWGAQKTWGITWGKNKILYWGKTWGCNLT